MRKQNFEQKDEKIKAAFEKLKKDQPEKLKKKLNLSWSNWGFGLETLQETAARLEKAGLKYIELHGNHYTDDLGYKPKETLAVLDDHNLTAAGICGMFSVDNDLSSNRPVQRQAALDYLKREIDFAAAVGGTYILVVPGAVGRPDPYDSTEFERSTETLRMAGDLFQKKNIQAAIEPIRAEEVSFVHTVADAKEYIAAVNHPGIGHINGDVFHMQTSESHIGEAIVDAGDMLTNLHMADSNRLTLGKGSLDLDTIIMALYCIGYNTEGRYVTPEPLGPGGNPYEALYGKPNKDALDELVFSTVTYFREREEELLTSTS